jgi:hypothetical protein
LLLADNCHVFQSRALKSVALSWGQFSRWRRVLACALACRLATHTKRRPHNTDMQRVVGKNLIRL